MGRVNTLMTSLHVWHAENAVRNIPRSFWQRHKQDDGYPLCHRKTEGQGGFRTTIK